MMSNYPPGVSGFEPQIAGLDETEMSGWVTCGYASTGHFSDEVDVDWECSFEGNVDGLLVGDRYNGFTFYFDCPECGQLDREKEIDMEDERE